MVMYKVTNLIGAVIYYKGIKFEPKETILLEEAPTSDRFYVEKVEEVEKKIKNERRSKK